MPSRRRERESTITKSTLPRLRRVGPLSLALALTALALAPLSPASAQCPGCDEYTLDIPTPGGNQPANPSQDPATGSEDPAAIAPAPAAPVPVSPTYPTAPATGDTYDGTTPVPVAPEGSGIRERRGPRLPVTMRTIVPHDPVAGSAQRPIVPAATTEPPERGSTLPLFGVMAVIAIAAAGVGFSRRQARTGSLWGRLAAR